MKDCSQAIVDHAESLFDAVGINRLPDGNLLLILGLESREDRDLDEFGRPNGEFQLYGFEKHVKPRLDSLVNFIRNNASSAETLGRFGYPLKGELNLKEEAIRAGLGKRGKNTVVLHPGYGPRLRFMAIKTDAPLDPLVNSPFPDEGSPVCSGCSICIDICPVQILEPYRMLDTSACLSNSGTMGREGPRLVNCDICLHQCPAGEEKQVK